MKVIESQGKTVDEAIENALRKLKVSRDNIEIEIIDKGSKGLFNFIGVRPAKIKIKVKRDYINEARKFLNEILDHMKIKAKIEIKEEKNIINIELVGNNMGVLIGRRGETLDSIQYLISLVINKNHEMEYKKVILDAENYRAKREATLRRLARKIGNKVKNTEKVVKLEPMNPYERRIIHSELQNCPYIQTYSQGEEPYRRVIVDIKKA